MPDFIPHETIICDKRDPPWINNRIKNQFMNETVAKRVIAEIMILKFLKKKNFFEEIFYRRSCIYLWTNGRILITHICLQN